MFGMDGLYVEGVITADPRTVDNAQLALEFDQTS